MKPHSIPILLSAWMLVTRVLAYPIVGVFRILHGRMGAPSDRFQERLGQPSQKSEGGVIWFHAASLGEVMQIGRLVETLDQTQNATILITTTTQAGADWVARELPKAVHQFVPVDIPTAVTGFLDHWSPRIAIFVEGDLSPRLVIETQRQGIPQVLLNARHSRTRARFPKIFALLLSGFSIVTCRSQAVVDEMLSLGVPADRVKNLPDLRFVAPQLPAPTDIVQSLSQKIGTRPVWLAASTHPDDENAVFAAHQTLVESFPDALLIIAPRHPDKRGAPLQAMAEEREFTAVRRSQNNESTQTTQVYIADTLGELGVFFALSPVAFVGGSFGQEGGHNPYEPARFGAAIVSGPRVKNFADAYASLTELGAAIQVDAPADLGGVMAHLFRSNQAEQMGQAGLAFMTSTEDSIAHYARLIAEILGAEYPDGKT